MNKQEFLAELQKELSGLSQSDIEERLNFYSEMIDDRMEEGLTEDEAVREIGTVNEVVSQTVAETPLYKLVKERVKPKRTISAWVIVLLVLGFPLWLPLLIAAFSVMLSVYIVIWSVLFSLWTIEISLVGCSLGGMISAVASAFQGNGATGIAMLGFAILCAGLSIFFFLGCKGITKGILILTKKMGVGIKSLFIRKEKVK